jgi:hypothetical protein
MVLLLFLAPACQPTVDLSGTYMANDYPWSGWPKIDITTDFPVPFFTGTFTVYNFFEYTEVPIAGPINNENEFWFYPYNDDPPISGLCVCQGFDDGSSIHTGSGEIADDGLSDRLACSTYMGEPFDPPAEVYRIDWPE